MSAMGELHAKVDEFEQLLHTVLGHGATDAAELATDAETAAKPVEAAAVTDAEELAKTAAAGLDPQPAPAAAPAPTETAPPAA